MGGEGGNEGACGMKVKLDVAVGLSMGGICVTVGDGVETIPIQQAARALIEAHEVGEDIEGTSLTILNRVMLDLSAAAHMIADRIDLERDKARARG